MSPREAAVSALLDEQGLDALVGCSYEALSYFAGTDIQTQLHLPERLEFFVAPRNAAPTLLVCNIEESQVRSQSPIGDVRSYVEFEHDPASELASLLGDAALRCAQGANARARAQTFTPERAASETLSFWRSIRALPPTRLGLW